MSGKSRNHVDPKKSQPEPTPEKKKEAETVQLSAEELKRISGGTLAPPGGVKPAGH